MNYNSATAIKIKEIREKMGYSSEAVADELGIAKSNYSKLENGKVEVTKNKLHSLAKIFNVPVVSFLPDSNYGKINVTNGDYSPIAETINNHSDPKVVHMLQQALQIIEKSVNDLKGR